VDVRQAVSNAHLTRLHLDKSMKRKHRLLFVCVVALAGCVQAPLSTNFYRGLGVEVGQPIAPAEQALAEHGFNCYREAARETGSLPTAKAYVLKCRASAGLLPLSSCWHDVNVRYMNGVIDDVLPVKPVCVGL
jgi:hypothetical protein